MKIYLIRHGQTKHNKLQLYQPDNAELSELGIKQAKVLAQKLSKAHIDAIYSSPLKRATQTAKIIGKFLNKKVIYSSLLREGENPSEFLNKKINSPEIIKIDKIKNLHANEPFWHYSDEENFADVRKRIKFFFTILSKAKKENILIISHRGTIKMLLLFMTNNRFDFKDFIRLSKRFKLNNTEVIYCAREKNGKWLFKDL